MNGRARSIVDYLVLLREDDLADSVAVVKNDDLGTFDCH